MIDFKIKRWTALAVFLIATSIGAQPQSPSAAGPTDAKPHANCPMMWQGKNSNANHSQHQASHLDEVNARGEKAMGFSQTATTHHFLLSPDGGAIQVEANDPQDAENRNQIRAHLKHIATQFRAGNFRIPMLVHDQVPPGVTTMERLREQIKFVYEETGQGGRVRISTGDKDALAAIHEFLRFQITDHQTGDPLEISTR